MPENGYIGQRNDAPKKRPRVGKALRSGNHGIRGSRKRRNGTGGMW